MYTGGGRRVPGHVHGVVGGYPGILPTYHGGYIHQGIHLSPTMPPGYTSHAVPPSSVVGYLHTAGMMRREDTLGSNL